MQTNGRVEGLRLLVDCKAQILPVRRCKDLEKDEAGIEEF